MSTFLELCQGVARYSGTVEASALTSVTGVSGRLEKIVYWTAEAWTRIQNDRDDWLFRRAEFSFDLIAGTAKYTPAAASISDLAKWIIAPDESGYYPTTIYDQDLGVADEGPIQAISWTDWRRLYGRGLQTNNRPTTVAISPANELCFGAIPDDNYKARGEYQQTPQTLAANGDEPVCPARFHDIIKWRALIFLHEHDEAQLNIATCIGNYNDMMADFERDQLPNVNTGGALA